MPASEDPAMAPARPASRFAHLTLMTLVMLTAGSGMAGLHLPGDGARRRLEVDALRLINEARRTAELGPLAVDAALSSVAREYADEMAERGFVGHISPRADRRTGGMRLAAGGVSDAEFGENVGRFGTSREGATWTDLLRELTRRLLDSPAHRPQMLGSSSTHAGTGIAFGTTPADADSSVRVPTIYLTQLFVARRAAIDRLAARIEGTALRVEIAGTLRVPGRPSLHLQRPGREPERVPLSVQGGAFTASMRLPSADGRSRLRLDIVDGTRTRPARRWMIDPLQPPDLAITSAPGDE